MATASWLPPWTEHKRHLGRTNPHLIRVRRNSWFFITGYWGRTRERRRYWIDDRNSLFWFHPKSRPLHTTGFVSFAQEVTTDLQFPKKSLHVNYPRSKKTIKEDPICAFLLNRPRRYKKSVMLRSAFIWVEVGCRPETCSNLVVPVKTKHTFPGIGILASTVRTCETSLVPPTQHSRRNTTANCSR